MKRLSQLTLLPASLKWQVVIIFLNVFSQELVCVMHLDVDAFVDAAVDGAEGVVDDKLVTS